jgi:Uma2 family endonuclease
MVANLKDLPRPHYTVEEYFALEQVSEARYEYWDGEIVCMSGGTERHYLISDNLHVLLSNLLKGRPCRANSAGTPIHTPTLPPYRYPDASVVCGKPVFTKVHNIDALTNPILVLEVLSPGIAARLGAQLREVDLLPPRSAIPRAPRSRGN